MEFSFWFREKLMYVFQEVIQRIQTHKILVQTKNKILTNSLLFHQVCQHNFLDWCPCSPRIQICLVKHICAFMWHEQTSVWLDFPQTPSQTHSCDCCGEANTSRISAQNLLFHNIKTTPVLTLKRKINSQGYVYWNSEKNCIQFTTWQTHPHGSWSLKFRQKWGEMQHKPSAQSPFSMNNSPACMYFSSCSRLCSTSAGVSVKIFFGGKAGTTLLPYSFFICWYDTKDLKMRQQGSQLYRLYSTSFKNYEYLRKVRWLYHSLFTLRTSEKSDR